LGGGGYHGHFLPDLRIILGIHRDRSGIDVLRKGVGRNIGEFLCGLLFWAASEDRPYWVID